MRCFLAFTPPPETALAIDQWRHRHWSVAGRDVPVQNLHMTLVFLGEVAPARLDTLLTLLDGTLSPLHSSGLPELQLNDAQYWSQSRCTVLCSAGESEPTALSGLVRSLRGLVNRAGIGADKRPLLSHVTLARRVSMPPGVPLVMPDFRWQSHSVELYRSHLKPEGPRYEEMASWRI